MPKLNNVKEKYVNGYQVDKETEDGMYSGFQPQYFDFLKRICRQTTGRGKPEILKRND